MTTKDLSFQRSQWINSSLGNPQTHHQDLAVYRGRAVPYDPARPWSEYALDQAEWRISVGCGTDAALNADRLALAAQRQPRSGCEQGE
jgi:hypothetical protein